MPHRADPLRGRVAVGQEGETDENLIKFYIKKIANYFQKKDHSFTERFVRFWKEIDLGTNEFNLTDKFTKISKQLNKNDLINFFNEHFISNKRKLSVQEFSSTPEKLVEIKEENSKKIGKIHSFNIDTQEEIKVTNQLIDNIKNEYNRKMVEELYIDESEIEDITIFSQTNDLKTLEDSVYIET